MYVPGTKIKKPFVRLAGEDGNAYSIMGRVTEALRRVGVPKNIVYAYLKKSTSGNYDTLLRVASEYSQEQPIPFEAEDGDMWDELDAEEIPNY